MVRVESKMCIKCGSTNIYQNEGNFVCKDCDLKFCVFEGDNESLLQ